MFRAFMSAILASIAIVSATTGCTRPQSETSKIQIALPSLLTGSQSLTPEDKLEHVVINVSGEGILRPILFTWNACQMCTERSAPSSFALDVPSGSNRLIQVLAVYASETTKQMRFFYGDKLQNLVSAEESADIPITSVSANSAIVSGQLAGRYLTSTTTGPTGPLLVTYTPPGKPSLIIERSFMVNGWFQVFGLAGLPLGYRHASGGLLFDKEVDLNDPAFTGSEKILKASVPVHHRKQFENGAIQWALEQAQIYVYGFFGPGVDATKSVCKPTTFPSLTNLAKADSADGSVALAAPPAVATMPSLAELVSTSAPLSSYHIQGGSNANSTCTSASATDLYSTYLSFKTELIDGNGNDRSAGFTVPFAWNANREPFHIDTSDPRVLTGQVLPGVENEFDGFQLFKRPTSESAFWIDKVNCLALATGAFGFTPAGTGSFAAGARDFRVQSNISAAEIANGVSAAICPTKAGQLAGPGVYIPRWAFGGPM